MDFSTTFINDIKIIIPELFLVSSILVLVTYGIILSTSLHYNYPLINKNILWLSVLILSLTLLLLLNNTISLNVTFNSTFIHDDLTYYSQGAILLVSIVCLVISQDYIETYLLNSYEYYVLLLCATLGLLVLVASYDFIPAYLAIEMQSLSLYILAAFKRNSAFATEAGLKYFILGTFSSGLILFGSSLIYGFTGTTHFENLFCLMTDLNFLEGNSLISITSTNLIFETYYYSGILIIASIFIAIGLLFKLAAAPFHMWSLDVYEGAPTSSTAFFAIVPKIAILVLFTRIFQNSVYTTIYWWQGTLAFCAISSVIVGSFVALKQRKLKRLIAYSAISHVGYLLIAFATGTSAGLQVFFFYILVYMITSICIWLIFMSLDLHSKTNSYLSDLSSLMNANPILAITFGLALFSLAGVPPLAGFYAKMLLFLAALESSMYILVVIGILSSVISTFYYIRIIKTMYFEKASNWNFYRQINLMKSFVLGVTLFLIVLLFLNPNLLGLWAYKMSISLL